MDDIETRTFALPEDQADFVDQLVQSGAFMTASEVVDAGLHALRDRDLSMESWLRTEVVPVARATRADPSRVIPASEVFAEIRALHRDRVDASRHDL